MFYTIMPLEVVMEGSETFEPVYSEMSWKNGGTLLVEEMGQNQAKVVRLISSDPLDYLDPAVQPGCIIEFKGNI